MCLGPRPRAGPNLRRRLWRACRPCHSAVQQSARQTPPPIGRCALVEVNRRMPVPRPGLPAAFNAASASSRKPARPSPATFVKYYVINRWRHHPARLRFRCSGTRLRSSAMAGRVSIWIDDNSVQLGPCPVLCRRLSTRRRLHCSFSSFQPTERRLGQGPHAGNASHNSPDSALVHHHFFHHGVGVSLGFSV